LLDEIRKTNLTIIVTSSTIPDGHEATLSPMQLG
jgi:hypothetical protein